MRKYRLKQGIAMRLTDEQRESIETLAFERELSMGEVCRLLIDEGLKSVANSRSSGRVL
jgi:hypothetical protein